MPDDVQQQPIATIQRDRFGRFSRGVSGNPNGKPPGWRGSLARIDEMTDAEAETIIKKMLDMAKAGDIGALNIVAQRLWPLRRGRPLPPIQMPPLRDADSIGEALSAIVSAAARGEISVTEASDLASVVKMYGDSLELCNMHRRLAALESRLGQRGGAQVLDHTGDDADNGDGDGDGDAEPDGDGEVEHGNATAE